MSANHRKQSAAIVAASWALSALIAGLPSGAGAAEALLARISTPKASAARALAPGAVPGCPDQGGLLDSITVPVDQPLDLSVVIGAPAPKGGVSYRVSSDTPAYVAAGDRRQGFLPVVTIPEGATESNVFTIFGISVGQTRLRLTSLTAGYGSGSYPLGAWDINKSGSGSDQKFLDANDPDKSCRVAGSPTLSNAAVQLASCGKPVKGVVSDGVSPLLLRAVAGLAGTACFEIVSTSTLDQGKVLTPLTGTTTVAPLNYGFSFYQPPKFYGDTSKSRTVEVEYSFTPSFGNGNTSRLRATMQVVRPPVVLVHGLWSNGGTWSSDFLRNDGFHTTEAADYAATNAASFSANNARVKTAAAAALKNIRTKGYAANQVDVVGHSMGGLLTRLYADAANYKRPDNLGLGDVHRLVTLDTPHWGSSFANLLVTLHNVNATTATKLETTVTTLTGGSVLDGAVCDLSENSTGLQALAGGTALPAQVISATGGPAGTAAAPARYWGGATAFGARSFEAALTETYCTRWEGINLPGLRRCTARAFYFPQTAVDAFRFREQNDAVVSLTSQRGGATGFNFAEYIHFHIPGIPGVQRGITDGANVATRTFRVLDGPEAGLVASLAAVPADGSGRPRTAGMGTATAAADFGAQCGAGGPMKRLSARPPGAAPIQVFQADPRVRIVSPAAGSAVAQGDAVTVVVELSPPLNAANTVAVAFSGLNRVEASWNGGQLFTAVLPSSALASGPLTLTPDFTDESGNISTGAPVVVVVKPASASVALALQQRSFFTVPGGAPRQLYVKGRLADGSEVDLASALMGTAYESSDAAVLGVTADGLVSPLAAGRATVTVRNGTLSDVASFVVEDDGVPLPPTSVSASVGFTRSGFRLDRSSGLYVQEISATNTSAASLAGPLYLVLRGLPAGVTLVSKSGLTEVVTPLGSPYLRLPLPGEALSLPPGGRVAFTLRFLNAQRVMINYSLDVVSSSAAP